MNVSRETLIARLRTLLKAELARGDVEQALFIAGIIVLIPKSQKDN